jgi:hypothetical protein
LGWTARDIQPELGTVNSSEETDMEPTAALIAVFVAIFVAIFLMLIMSGERSLAAEERAHARRIAEAKMNARLLRFNI